MIKVIALPDLQVPYHHKEAIRIVRKYMEEHSWDYLILMGDFLDYFCISRFNEGKPGMVEGKTIMDELGVGQTVLKGLIESARKVNKRCKIVYLEGNHENRAYQFSMMFPTFKGIIEPENVLEFEKLGIQYVRSWSQSEPFNIGKAYFTHGRYTNMHHAKKMVEAFEENVFYGHTHDCNSFYKTSQGTGKTKVGQSLGCLCDYPKELDYTKGGPKNWQLAFGVFYFLDNGNFNYYIPKIFDNKFISPEGKIYS